MDLSQDIKDTLLLTNNTNNVNDEGFRKLLDNAFASLLNKPEIHSIANINSSKSDVVKEIYTALLTFIAQVARHRLSTEQLSQLLEKDLCFSSVRTQVFCKMYSVQKEKIHIVLSMIGSHNPHIVDVNWKLDHVVKMNIADASSGPIYRIRLSTEVNDESSNSTRKIEYIHFNCDTQQLQDLVYKLKDAARHCEKIANQPDMLRF